MTFRGIRTLKCSNVAAAAHNAACLFLLTGDTVCSGEDTPWYTWYFVSDWGECQVYKAPECEVVEYQCEKICKSEKVRTYLFIFLRMC